MTALLEAVSAQCKWRLVVSLLGVTKVVTGVVTGTMFQFADKLPPVIIAGGGISCHHGGVDDPFHATPSCAMPADASKGVKAGSVAHPLCSGQPTIAGGVENAVTKI